LVNIPSSTSNAEICLGSTYSFNGISATQAGTYSVNLTSQFGCDSTAILNLIVHPLPVLSVQDTLVCENTLLTLVATGAQSYVWDVPQNANGSITVSPAQTSTYYVYGMDQYGCVSESVPLTVFVDPNPMPSFYIDPVQVDIDNPTITIYNTTNGNNQNTWSILGASFVNNQSSFSYQLPYQEGTFSIQLNSETAIGCVDSLMLNASVRDNIALYVPNTFTPDAKEFNTIFLPIFSTGFVPKNYHLSVFNRWGEEVFHSGNYLIGWDGRFQFVLCPDGTYSYQITYQRKESEAPIVLVGHVNLLH